MRDAGRSEKWEEPVSALYRRLMGGTGVVGMVMMLMLMLMVVVIIMMEMMIVACHG